MRKRTLYASLPGLPQSLIEDLEAFVLEAERDAAPAGWTPTPHGRRMWREQLPNGRCRPLPDAAAPFC